MAPFGREPGVIEVEPSNQRADVKSSGDGIQFEAGSRHPAPIWNVGAWDNRPEKLNAGRIIQGQQGTAQGIHQTVPRGLVSFAAENRSPGDVIGDLLEQGIKRRADIESIL